MTGTTTAKVRYRWRIYGIRRRRPGTRPILEDLTEELLRYLYLDRAKSTVDIATLRLLAATPSTPVRVQALSHLRACVTSVVCGHSGSWTGAPVSSSASRARLSERTAA
jgi:hypothetical protein